MEISFNSRVTHTKLEVKLSWADVVKGTHKSLQDEAISHCKIDAEEWTYSMALCTKQSVAMKVSDCYSIVCNCHGV